MNNPENWSMDDVVSIARGTWNYFLNVFNRGWFAPWTMIYFQIFSQKYCSVPHERLDFSPIILCSEFAIITTCWWNQSTASLLICGWRPLNLGNNEIAIAFRNLDSPQEFRNIRITLAHWKLSDPSDPSEQKHLNRNSNCVKHAHTSCFTTTKE